MLSLLQLDANLIEGEPNNCLIRKIKKTTDKLRDNFKYLINLESGSKICKKLMSSLWGPVQCRRRTVLFRAHPPGGSKNVIC